MTRFRAPLALVLAFLPLLAAPAAATKYAGEFLRIPVGARAIGLGGAFTAVDDDATSPYWNPAGMIYLPYKEALFQHAEKFGNLLNQDYLSAVYPIGTSTDGHGSAVGISIVRVAVDDIQVTPRPDQLALGDFLDYGQDGQPFTYDPGEGNGTWDPGERLLIDPSNLYLASSSEMAFVLSYARHRGEHFAFGGNLKFIRQSIPGDGAVYDAVAHKVTSVDKATSFGAGLDAGLLWMPTDAVTIGAMLRDVTRTYLAWSNGSRELIDPTLNTGASFNFYPAPRHAITWGVDLGWDFSNRKLDGELKLGGVTADVRTGVEYWYHDMLALRTGFEGKNLSFGAGLRYKQVGVDYAASLHRFFAADDSQFADDTDLDATHIVSLGVNW